METEMGREKITNLAFFAGLGVCWGDIFKKKK